MPACLQVSTDFGTVVENVSERVVGALTVRNTFGFAGFDRSRDRDEVLVDNAAANVGHVMFAALQLKPVAHVRLHRHADSAIVRLVRLRSVHEPRMVQRHLPGFQDEMYRFDVVEANNALPSGQDVVFAVGVLVFDSAVAVCPWEHGHTAALQGA